MIFTEHKNIFRWVIVSASFILAGIILWKTYMLFQNFKEEERYKMENWSFAQTNLINNHSNIDLDLTLKILNSNKTTPMLVINEDGSLSTYNNINNEIIKNTASVKKLICKFEEENPPIVITLENSHISTLYYGNSPLLNKVKYYPIALFLILILLGTIIYFFYRSNKNAIQNKLWSGMAKETAHQIGTPLSSLIGWTEILKSENTNPDYIIEIEKDIDRLQTITERFSKIGSIPKLEIVNIIEETLNSYKYLKTRSSHLINFEIKVPNTTILAYINKQLYSWTIENLVKNAIDAMKGRGKLTIKIYQLKNDVYIDITDTGKGIYKKDFNRIFETGFTTKKRGWGLGLSLTKRIIEDFHDGKIKVLQSKIGVGTTIQIHLKCAKNNTKKNV